MEKEYLEDYLAKEEEEIRRFLDDLLRVDMLYKIFYSQFIQISIATAKNGT